jgi:hypothetical protein
MNERIRLLALKASNPKTGWLDRQKFAELIVRECGQWVNDNLGLLDEEARADLLKHFGVEE